MQNTICNPTFVELRDQILAAARTSPLHHGEDVCRIWRAFAASGLGENAHAGPFGSDGKNPVEDFTLPSYCGPADVWVEDTPYPYAYNNPADPADSGAEPDPALANENMWESRGIWVRNGPGAGTFGDARDHQNPEFGQTNYVHMRVGNRHPSGAAQG